MVTKAVCLPTFFNIIFCVYQNKYNKFNTDYIRMKYGNIILQVTSKWHNIIFWVNNLFKHLDN